MKRLLCSLQTAAPSAEQSHGDSDVSHQGGDIPDVCFIPDICKALRVSRRTVERLLRFDAFPIPQIGALDRRHRWSGARVREFRDSGQSVGRHGRTVKALRVVRKPNRVAPQHSCGDGA